MSAITKEHIELFKKYFLSTDESVKDEIFSSLSDADKECLSVLENGFDNNISTAEIAVTINAVEFENEIKQIQTEYNNLLQAFEKEIAVAIAKTERETIKKKFQTIDLEVEMAVAITEVERASLKEQLQKLDEVKETKIISFSSFAKYAIAAAIMGVVVTGGYLLLNNKSGNDNNLAKTKNIKAPKTVALPTIENQAKQMKVLVPESMGFAKDNNRKLTVVTQDIEAEIDTLKNIYTKEVENKQIAGDGNLANELRKEMDSLQLLTNTYHYDVEKSKLTVRLKKGETINDLILISPENKDGLFVKIKEQYYIIKASSEPLHFIPLKDKSMIETLDRIIFQTQ